MRARIAIAAVVPLAGCTRKVCDHADHASFDDLAAGPNADQAWPP